MSVDGPIDARATFYLTSKQEVSASLRTVMVESISRAALMAAHN